MNEVNLVREGIDVQVRKRSRILTPKLKRLGQTAQTQTFSFACVGRPRTKERMPHPSNLLQIFVRKPSTGPRRRELDECLFAATKLPQFNHFALSERPAHTRTRDILDFHTKLWTAGNIGEWNTFQPNSRPTSIACCCARSRREIRSVVRTCCANSSRVGVSSNSSASNAKSVQSKAGASAAVSIWAPSDRSSASFTASWKTEGSCASTWIAFFSFSRNASKNSCASSSCSSDSFRLHKPLRPMPPASRSMHSRVRQKRCAAGQRAPHRRVIHDRLRSSGRYRRQTVAGAHGYRDCWSAANPSPSRRELRNQRRTLTGLVP